MQGPHPIPAEHVIELIEQWHGNGNNVSLDLYRYRGHHEMAVLAIGGSAHRGQGPDDGEVLNRHSMLLTRWEIVELAWRLFWTAIRWRKHADQAMGINNDAR